MDQPTLPFVFEHPKYVVDSSKNLYAIHNGEYHFISKLKRHLHSISEYNGRVWFCDRFGDCYALENDLSFVFGVLNTPLYFTALSSGLALLDSYKRAWLCSYSGKIIEICFLDDNSIEEQWNSLVNAKWSAFHS